MTQDPPTQAPPAFRRVGAVLLAALYAGLALGTGVLLARSMGAWTAWQTYSAQAAVAMRVLEDPLNADDPTLGWKHVPGRSVAMTELGPDVVWTINSQGLRAPRDYDAAIPAGKRRVVALGDSFTFGNTSWADTWPAQLERALTDTEVLNMGASGYGVDQMYLWYRSDGVRFDTDDVVLALIDDDMRRAHLDRWPSGHGRPLFKLFDGKLTLTNVPVPPRIPAGQPLVGGLGFVRFYATWVIQGPADQTWKPEDRVAPEAVPLAIVAALADLVHERGDRLTVVLLPTNGLDRSPWLDALEPVAKEHGFAVHDLTPGFLAGQAGEQTRTTPEWYLPDGHYNARGNGEVARQVAGWLSPTPASP